LNASGREEIRAVTTALYPRRAAAAKPVAAPLCRRQSCSRGALSPRSPIRAATRRCVTPSAKDAISTKAWDNVPGISSITKIDSAERAIQSHLATIATL
jgi:hypothetical protein